MFRTLAEAVSWFFRSALRLFDFSTSDFLSLSFVFIDIPGSFVHFLGRRGAIPRPGVRSHGHTTREEPGRETGFTQSRKGRKVRKEEQGLPLRAYLRLGALARAVLIFPSTDGGRGMLTRENFLSEQSLWYPSQLR